MSILTSILVSAAGCFIAILGFILCLAIYDCIYESREEKKRIKMDYDEWN